jgi:addiction module RelB/DinJ family antitoxin
MSQSASIVNVRVDANVKRDIERLFDGLGMNISTAVNMFFRQCLMEQGLPYQPRIRHTRQSLNEYLEAYHEKDIETILKEVEECNEKSVEIDWGKPVGAEVW